MIKKASFYEKFLKGHSDNKSRSSKGKAFWQKKIGGPC